MTPSKMNMDLATMSMNAATKSVSPVAMSPEWPSPQKNQETAAYKRYGKISVEVQKVEDLINRLENEKQAIESQLKNAKITLAQQQYDRNRLFLMRDLDSSTSPLPSPVKCPMSPIAKPIADKPV